MISFKSAHFPKNIILRAVFFYVRHALSYRGPEEILEKRSVKVDNATLNRWFVRHSSPLAIAAKIVSVPLQLRGVWKKLTSRTEANEFTSIKLPINLSADNCDFMPYKNLRPNRTECLILFNGGSHGFLYASITGHDLTNKM